MKRFSLLELLHPDGSASTSFVLGSNCPKPLYPEPPSEFNQKIELLILAPSAKECKSKGWLDEAAKFVNDRLSEDGLCYVLAPLPWRLKLFRLLSKADMVRGGSFWHFPDWTSSHYLIPLQPGPAQFAVEEIIPAPRWKRILAQEMFRSASGRKLLSMFWESVGASVRRSGARPLFEWLSKSEPQEASLETALIRKSWRDLRGATILYCFTERDVWPSAIAKIGSVEASAAGLEREAEVLEALGPAAQREGIRVPQILLKQKYDQRSALFLSPIPGQPASDLLALNPALFFPIFIKIVDWLERWHIATVHVRPPHEEQLVQDYFAPMERLTPFLQNAEGYRNWLEDRIRAAARTPLPFVATHNDLTMANVLVDEHDSLGVVDWETGRVESWPLVDFYYAVTDAIRIAQGSTSWLEAFKACYQPNGLYNLHVTCWAEQLCSAIKISTDFAELYFHACWLHHASNEHSVSQPGAPRPFLQIVQWLALNYSKLNDNQN